MKHYPSPQINRLFLKKGVPEKQSSTIISPKLSELGLAGCSPARGGGRGVAGSGWGQAGVLSGTKGNTWQNGRWGGAGTKAAGG